MATLMPIFRYFILRLFYNGASMIKFTRFLANRFTAFVAVSVLLMTACSALAQTRAIIYTKLAPTPSGIGGGGTYGIGLADSLVDLAWRTLNSTHFINGDDVWIAEEIHGVDSNAIRLGRFTALAFFTRKDDALWPWKVASSFAGASVSGGYVTGAGAASTPFFKAETIDLHGLFTAHDTLTGIRFITATSEPATPQFKYVVRAADIPVSSDVVSWLASITIGGKDSLPVDTADDPLSWYIYKNSTEIDSGTYSNWEAGLWLTFIARPQLVTVGDTLSVALWSSRASSFYYNMADIYILPAILAHPDSTDHQLVADSLWPVDTLAGSIPGVGYDQSVPILNMASPFNYTLDSLAKSYTPATLPIFFLQGSNYDYPNSNVPPITDTDHPILISARDLRRYVRRIYVTHQ
jgi:hypothetical protein